MPKNRTNINVLAPIAAEPKDSKKSISMFMVTINPNKRFESLETPDAKMMIVRLQNLSNFLLKKKNILAGLIFKDRPPKDGEVAPPPSSREHHISRVLNISEDRTGAVEWGARDKKLHMHIEFIIEHRTFLHLSRDYYLDIAETFTGLPKSGIHLNFRGATQAEGYKKYVTKHANEGAKHFFDKSAGQFINESHKL